MEQIDSSVSQPADNNVEGQTSAVDKTTPPDTLISRDEGLKYWNGAECDVNGMLGGIPTLEGFSTMSRVDLQSSRNFLAKLGIGSKPGQRTVHATLEGGAGIGRVTEGLLLKVSEVVDVVEPVAKFTASLQGKDGVRDVFNIGLEDWIPNADDQYDLFWTQWCVGHLTDEQLVQYLERCKKVLNPDGGVIVIKENLSNVDRDMFDTTDSSVTRQDSKFRALFKQAGLRIVKTELQRGLPKSKLDELLPIRVYALKSELARV
ncbi:alpha-N-methyltransferase NTM1 [Xylariales sp. AK1849]|nr:alpha-N-methyltransferase NTM1 [Xylariales sp. AK1849]